MRSHVGIGLLKTFGLPDRPTTVVCIKAIHLKISRPAKIHAQDRTIQMRQFFALMLTRLCTVDRTFDAKLHHRQELSCVKRNTIELLTFSRYAYDKIRIV
jgi:hypothetical protein